MKRNLIFFIITAVCLSMTACGGGKDKSDEKTKPDKVQTETITEETSEEIPEETTEETTEEKYSPMDVQEEGNIDLDEDETFVIQ